MHLESLLVGVIVSSGLMYVWNKICDVRQYFEFRDWCDDKGITSEDLTKDSMKKYYTMWKLSLIDGVEVVEVKPEDSAK